MEASGWYGVLIVVLLGLVFFNALLSKDIYNWVPSLKRQIGLYALVWLLPVAGFFLANKIGDLRWFQSRKVSGGGSAIAGGLLQADSVFNPGAKHQMEIVEKREAEIHNTHDQTDNSNKNDAEET